DELDVDAAPRVGADALRELRHRAHGGERLARLAPVDHADDRVDGAVEAGDDAQPGDVGAPALDGLRRGAGDSRAVVSGAGPGHAAPTPSSSRTPETMCLCERPHMS